jgi:hypothetical protein
MTSIEWLKQTYKVSGKLTDSDFEYAQKMVSVEKVNSDCLNSTFIRKELIDEAKEMYKKEMEILYTEEQVREAIQKARHSYAVSNDIIQSLKLPKKD